MSLYEDHAHLYDVAFSWDITDEVGWLLSRLGPATKIVLEPGCGSGRMFPPFASRGVEVVGVELSKTMIGRARERMAVQRLPAPRIHCGDMANFDLGEMFDGAICPVSSFSYLLTPEAVSSHLTCMAKHLRPGCKYLVQKDCFDFNDPPTLGPEDNRWEMERDELKVRTEWFLRSFDAENGLATEVCRFEVLAGPGAGTITEDTLILRQWTWEEWAGLIDTSPFTLVACYDGNTSTREFLPLDGSARNCWLVWHELALA